MDAGDIILSKETQIHCDDTSEDLFERLGNMGAELLSETIDAISTGTAPKIKQNHAEATYAPLLSKDFSQIDFTQSAASIKNKVRALIPWPVATVQLGEKVLKIYSIDISSKKTDHTPGTVIAGNPNGIEIACSDGSVIIKRLQAPGGSVLSADDYLRGNTIK